MTVARSLVLLLALTSFVSAADWSQWRGPNRSAVVTDFKAPASWPKELKKKWSTSVGDGVATPALVGDKLYAYGYQNGKEVIRCLDASSGKELWKDEYEAKAAGGPARNFPAARCSPAVAGGKVVTFGVKGTLTCLDAVKGTVIWRKNSTGGVPGFSTSSSPLLADGLCVIQAGSDRGGSVIAYDLADGKEKWKWSSDGTKYASPMLLTLNDLKAVVVETASTISAVNLANGQLLWSTEFSTRYNASTPMVVGEVLYYAGSGQPTRDHHGPRAVLNALERLVGAYGSECTRVRQDLSIAEAQLRDYQARLGKPFAHEAYLSELTSLRDQLKAGLSATAHQAEGGKGPDVSELSERIKALKAANTIEASPKRAQQKHSSAEEPVTARIRRRQEASPVSDQAVEQDGPPMTGTVPPPEVTQNSPSKPPLTFQERIAMERENKDQGPILS